MRWIATFLILILFLPASYKLTILIDYSLRRDFIATELCVEKAFKITVCYGHCYLKKKMDIPDASGQETGKVLELKQTISPYTLSSSKLTLSRQFLGNTHQVPNRNSLLKDFHIEDFFRPPQMG